MAETDGRTDGRQTRIDDRRRLIDPKSMRAQWAERGGRGRERGENNERSLPRNEGWEYEQKPRDEARPKSAAEMGEGAK